MDSCLKTFLVFSLLFNPLAYMVYEPVIGISAIFRKVGWPAGFRDCCYPVGVSKQNQRSGQIQEVCVSKTRCQVADLYVVSLEAESRCLHHTRLSRPGVAPWVTCGGDNHGATVPSMCYFINNQSKDKFLPFRFLGTDNLAGLSL